MEQTKNKQAPQEKAKEFVDKMYSVGGIDCYEAKECALIAVDEILNFQKNIIDKYLELSFVTFWTEVKKEIQNL